MASAKKASKRTTAKKTGGRSARKGSARKSAAKVNTQTDRKPGETVAAGASGRATTDTGIIDKRTGVMYQPVVNPGSSVPIAEEVRGQAPNKAPKRESTEPSVTGATVDRASNEVRIKIDPGTKAEKHDDKEHGELHTPAENTLDPKTHPKTFKPRQAGALDVHAATADKVEPDDLGATRTAAGA